jgi:hypothetical protein
VLYQELESFEQTVWFYECRSVTMYNERTGGKVNAHASLLIRSLIRRCLLVR